ncbi:Crp/Fnr family transcriptional regulator [Niabella yanshanensis]|uniref:Crp/Fnr family transcriptional regulator n=1 Tax=Niabella yanshanensis TaxID=577386 RepID=A0ABZ0WBH6_9BACT|nr:Crp/Fnr family transcriptional regulator [Niabella yanshanensis]WQD39928.1 Crp/Fnr family transcriptional regulator [Niabella yanshanensis]
MTENNPILPGFPEKESADLLRISNIKLVKKDEYFISEGQIPRKFAIVLSGSFRYYYVNEKGDEFTKGFILKNAILSAYSAMVQRSPSLFNIQALEPAQILEVNYQSWLQLRSSNGFWDRFLIRALEKGYFAKEKRERELLLLDAASRYQIFLSEFPGLDKKVKLHIIASYIGIQPESLSRIRKKLGN